MIGIEIARAQAAAVDHVGGEPRAPPEIGHTGRPRPNLGVIGVDPMIGDVVQICGTKQVLVGNDIGRLLARPRPVRVGLEVAVGVDALELADVLRAIVIESVQDIGSAELAVVEQVARVLEIGVGADLEPGKNILQHADVEHVRALRQHRAVRSGRGRRLHGGAVRDRGRAARDQGHVAGCGDHLHRRREVARVAGVERRARGRLVDHAGARAELVGIGVLIHLIEAKPADEGELVGDLPLVRHVDAGEPAQQRARIRHAERNVGQDLRAGGRVDRQQLVVGLHQRLLAAHVKPAADGVRIGHAPGRIGLDAVDQAAAEHVGRSAVEHEVADRVREEVDTRVAGEIGELRIEIGERFLQREHGEVVALDLVLVELCGIEKVHAERRE